MYTHNLLNTHTYDGKLTIELLPSLTLVQSLTPIEKQCMCEQLLNHSFQQIARHYLINIIKDIGSIANVDNSNNLVAEDLLCLCVEHQNNEEFMETLEAQLIDMNTGFCPQGRCIRLFQTILAFN